MTTAEKTDTRQRILEAAVERIVHYGYAKTTMSEIARDCDMSAGNIYRFFASKLDIAEAMARKFNAEVYQALAGIVRTSGSAEGRLRELFSYIMETTYEKLASDDKILEVAEVLARERPEFANEELAQERHYIVGILKEGQTAGEFATIKDPDYVAEIIQSCMMKFSYPQLFSKLTLPQLRREFDGAITMVIAGLKHGCYMPKSES